MTEATDEQLEAFRQEARDWLNQEFPALKTDHAAWGKKLGAKGWATPTWPAEYGGGGLSQKQAQVLAQEMATIGATNPLIFSTGMGVTMVGPTILDYGTEQQKKKHLPPICRGDVCWAVGYSEPNAGSDLASLQMRAIDEGDHWVVNGQKTWTSGADRSDWCGTLVRTDPEAPKRKGISFLMIDMHQTAIETRPIELISGSSPFCETFFNDARVDKNDLLGELNAGWSVGKRLLQHERSSQTGVGMGGGGSRATLPELARKYVGTDDDGRLSDTDLRSRLTENLMDAKAISLTAARIRDESRGQAKVTAAASIMKNASSSMQQRRAELCLEIMGHSGLGWEQAGFTSEEVETVRGWLASKAVSIYGGSYEIQNNIISKNILGLPETTQRG